jgi:hypothetical protein
MPLQVGLWRQAAVLLSNTASSATAPALRHLLNTNFRLPALHRQVPIDPEKLTAYAGRYPLTPRFVLTVTPTDGHLMVESTGQDEYGVFPESDTRSFYRVVDAQITFELAPDGTVIAAGIAPEWQGCAGRLITLRWAALRKRARRSERNANASFGRPSGSENPACELALVSVAHARLVSQIA